MSTKRTSEELESPLESPLGSPNTRRRYRRLTVVVRNGRSMDCMSRNIVPSGSPVAYSPKNSPDSPMYDGSPPSPKNGPDSPVFQEGYKAEARSPKSQGFNPESPSYNPHSPQPACWGAEDEEEDCRQPPRPLSPVALSPVV